MIPIVALAGPRDLLRHRWQGALSILGIALGVAVVIAVDIASSSANRAFALSLERIAGRATHQIESATGRISDTEYGRLAQLLDQFPATIDASPVIESRVWIGGTALTLLGVDLLAPKRLDEAGGTPDAGAIADLLTEPGALVMSAEDARDAGISVGDRFELESGGTSHQALLAGIMIAPGSRISGIVFADIAAAQELTGSAGWINRVDLALALAEAESLAAALPPGMRLVPSSRRGDSMRQMTRSFRINLTAMSLLALLVGAFIVYNTMTFTVLRRRPLLGTLRTLGCTRAQLFVLILGESLLLALLGSLLGVPLGILTGWGLVQLVIGTINDLYFSLSVGALHLSAGPIALGVALGVVVTLLASLGPALEAARSEPRDVLRSGLIERHGQRWVSRLALGGVLLLAAGLALAEVESRSMALGFAALLLAVLGFSLLVPALLQGLALAIAWSIGRGPFPATAGATRVGALLAARGIGTSIVRTGISTAALTVAVSATVGVGIMIGSFRGSLVDWLETTLQSDIYVSAPDATGERPGGRLPPALIDRVSAVDGVAVLSMGRRAKVDSTFGPIALLALDLRADDPAGFHFMGEHASGLWKRFRSGELILASEPFTYRHRLGVGDQLRLFTASGWQQFEIGGVFRDYGTDSGLLAMARQTYAHHWGDTDITTLGLALLPGADPTATLVRVRAATRANGEPALISANREIREQSLEIFDRTFAITRVLRLLALGVAFIGVLSALMALQLERRREHAILRAIGMTPIGLGAVILLQTSILGLAAGLLAIPLGVLLGDLLIQVVNLRSFGWTMELRLTAADLYTGILLAWTAALIAGAIPAIQAARPPPADALRAE